MTDKRVFYVLFISNPTLQSLLDAIRLVSDPSAKQRAHITVRGPYRRRRRFPAQQALTRGARVDVDGVGTFFEGHQNTVYLRCHSDVLQRIWDKPDFGFAPHITIYDGDSREFAERLFEIVRTANPRFSFVAESLDALSAQAGQSDFGLLVHVLNGLGSEIVDLERAHSLGATSDEERLDLVRRLLEQVGLASTSVSSSPRTA